MSKLTHSATVLFILKRS